jgi:polysaccharide export outer membrane protein
MHLWRNLTSLLLVAFLALSTASVSAQNSSLGAGDLVKISVYGQPDLNTVTRIGSDNRINFPLIGSVRIGGLTLTAAEQLIAAELKRRNFVRNAQVSILLEEQRATNQNSVTILGQVQTPGKYPLQEVAIDGVKTLVDLIAQAGGLKKEAADHLLLLDNAQGSGKQKIDLIALLQLGDLENNARLRGGEVVVVPAMEVFYIYGHVAKPGRYRMQRNMTVMQAISVSGGITATGSENGIVIKRNSGKRVESINAKLDSALRKNDVLYVKKSIF